MVGENTGNAKTRRTVSVLFADVVDSTLLTSQLDPEVVRGALARYWALAAAVVARHGGTVEKYVGDAVMAVFGLDELHEDDALRAVRTAHDLLLDLHVLNDGLDRDLGVRLELRVGIATGELVAGGAVGTLATGPAVNLAARLQAVAPNGATVMDEATWRRVRHAVRTEALPPQELKGIPGRVHAHAVRGPIDISEAIPRRLDTPLVGRAAELEALHDVFARVVSERRSGSAIVIGPAGIGKSRLVHEFVAEARNNGARILRGRCPPYGSGVTLHPIVEIIQAVAGIEPHDTRDGARTKVGRLTDGWPEGDLIARRLATLIGILDEPAPFEELTWSVRRMVEHVASSSSTIVVVDDVQWAAAPLLELLDDVVERTRPGSLLLIAIARPDVDDEQVSWLDRRGASIRLETLPLADVTEMVRHEIGADEIDDGLVGLIAEVTDGNPLFVEQYLALLLEEGLVSKVNDGIAATQLPADLPTPATVEALLASRVDRLPEPERRVAELASTVGRTFWRGALLAIADDVDTALVDAGIDGLHRRDLLLPSRSELPGEEAHRFRHVLVRDAAYRRLTKADRAALHERVARWLEGRVGDRRDEYRELIGYHFETAALLLREVGRSDPQLEALERAAAEQLIAAGRRSLAIGDYRSAAAVLRRADRLLPRDNVLRLETASDLAYALVQTARVDEALAFVGEAVASARASGDERLILRLRVDQAMVGALGVGSHIDAELDLDAVIARLAASRDAQGQAVAWHLRAWDLFQEDRTGPAVEAAARAALFAREAGNGYLQQAVFMSGTSYYGPLPARRALAAAQATLADPDAGLVRRAEALIDVALMRAILGDPAGARAALREADATWTDVGSIRWELGKSEFEAIVEDESGHPEAAEAALRAGIARLEQASAGSYLEGQLWRLADLLCRVGRTDEAQEIIDRAAALDPASSADDWHYLEVKARIASAQGRHHQAIELSRRALHVLQGSDRSPQQADVRLAVAHIHRQAGDVDAAIAVASQALALFERKEHLTGVARTRSFLRTEERC